jgi:hypothetical protein
MAKVLQRVLSMPSDTVPLHLSSFRVDLDYLPDQWPDEHRRETLDDGFSELQDALRLGFFDWTGAGNRTASRVDTDWSRAGKLSITVDAAGVHSNAIVVLLRLIVRLHHVSQEDFDELHALLGDEAAGLPARTVFAETISGIRVGALARADGAPDVATDLLAFVSDGVRRPQGAALPVAMNDMVDPERLLAVGDDGHGWQAQAFNDIEDVFLRLLSSGAFTPLDPLDCKYADNEPELFMRERGGASELVVDNYDQQLYGLVELLNVMAGGRVETLTVTHDEQDG